MDPQYVCSARTTLWERYRVALESYLEAIAVLDEAGSGPRFDDAVAQARRARGSFERFWDDYCQHVLSHGCRQEVSSVLTSTGALATSAGMRGA